MMLTALLVLSAVSFALCIEVNDTPQENCVDGTTLAEFVSSLSGKSCAFVISAVATKAC